MTTNNTNSFVENDSVEWQEVDENVKRKIMSYDEKLMLVEVEFQKGGIGPIHDHYHSQTSYVISGSFDVTIGDQTKNLKAGDVFYIPPHVPHGAVCLEKGILLDFFSPMREDFF